MPNRCVFRTSLAVLYLAPCVVVCGQISVEPENTIRPVSSYYSRLERAEEGAQEAVSVKQKCTILIAALRQEVKDAAPGVRSNSYFSNSEFLQEQYIEKIESLGADALEGLREAPAARGGELDVLLACARARLGDEAVVPQLIDVVRESRNDFLRAMAVRSMSEVKGAQVLSVLKEMLNDPYVRVAEDSLGKYEIHLIREEAARALTRLGYSVKLTASGLSAVGPDNVQ